MNAFVYFVVCLYLITTDLKSEKVLCIYMQTAESKLKDLRFFFHHIRIECVCILVATIHQ